MKLSEHLNWHEQALCRTRPAAMQGADFFPENRRSTGAKRAKQFCGICPVRIQCLDFALAGGERFGIWGGTDPQERAWLQEPTHHSTGQESDVPA